MAVHLAPFDPNRDLVVQADFTCAGQNLSKGDPFDKSLVEPRRVRLLYEARRIGYPPTDEPAPARAKFSSRLPAMTDDDKAKMVAGHSKVELQRMVEGLKVTVDPKWTKAELVDEIARHRRGPVNG